MLSLFFLCVGVPLLGVFSAVKNCFLLACVGVGGPPRLILRRRLVGAIDHNHLDVRFLGLKS